TFWQQMPIAPAATCRSAMPGHRCALPCARTRTPRAAAWPCSAATLASKASRSRISAGVSTRSSRSPGAAGGAMRCPPAAPPALLLDDIDALGRDESERLGRHRGVSGDCPELERRRSPERVADLHRAGQAVAKAERDALDAGLLVARQGLDPFESVARRQLAQREVLLQITVAEEDRRRRRAQCVGKPAYGDLVQVLVEEVKPLAIGDEQLLERPAHVPAEAPGP